MNYVESHLNGILLTVAYLPKSDKFTLTTLNSNIPLELFQVCDEKQKLLTRRTFWTQRRRAVSKYTRF